MRVIGRFHIYGIAALCAGLSVLGPLGCSGGGAAPPPPCSLAGCGASGEAPEEPGTLVSLQLPAAEQAELSDLEGELERAKPLDGAALLAKHPRSFGSLGYDPLTAANLDLIQRSQLQLNPLELERLGQNGFVIARSRVFPHMAYGLENIYAHDLPVYVSLDMILDAVHLSYDAILKSIEAQALAPAMQRMIAAARAKLERRSDLDPELQADLDLYLTVAASLASDRVEAPLLADNRLDVSTFVTKAKAASGIEPISLFGVRRNIDFTQFKPRGHYVESASLERYFRAMMWLGRIEFRLIETKPDRRQMFHRRQFEATVVMRELIDGAAAPDHQLIDRVVGEFVGEHDYMPLAEVEALLADLRASTLEQTRKLSDSQIARAIVDGRYGAQRIASQVIYKDPAAGPAPLPLDRSFALLGQRYVVDSHVFSNVVYDRVPDPGGDPRLLPDPLDAAFAALGNDAALPLLKPALDRFRYAPQLERTRMLVDAHGDDFWQANLYNLWLSALRAMSPELAAEGTPAVTRTEAWSRRVLNTQLASWAELRHDTILYAKQSYTTGIACEFPDAYVDPYPEAFERIAAFGARGKTLAELVAPNTSSEFAQQVRDYFGELESIANLLRDMALQQRSGVPFTAVQLAFINEAVKSRVEGCGGPRTYSGWYARLLFDKEDSDMKPTIADVHTYPGDEPPPQVLHVATGLPRMMVVTADTCSGPRAYVGLAFAYHEVVTGLERLTDEQWKPKARDAADVSWVEPIAP